MNENLYHAEVWMPADLANAARSMAVSLRYTSHALNQAAFDRYGRVDNLPAYFVGKDWSVFEVAAVGREVRKVAARRSLGDGRSLCVVLRPDRNGGARWFVVTVWVNLDSDKHRSLARAKYVQAPMK